MVSGRDGVYLNNWNCVLLVRSDMDLSDLNNLYWWISLLLSCVQRCRSCTRAQPGRGRTRMFAFILSVLRAVLHLLSAASGLRLRSRLLRFVPSGSDA